MPSSFMVFVSREPWLNTDYRGRTFTLRMVSPEFKQFLTHSHACVVLTFDRGYSFVLRIEFGMVLLHSDLRFNYVS